MLDYVPNALPRGRVARNSDREIAFSPRVGFGAIGYGLGMAVVLGIDSSTQSVKVEVRDVDTGRLVASGRASHPSTTPPQSEQDPTTWWNALVAAVHAALSAAGDHNVTANEVVAMSVAGQQHGMVALDERGDLAVALGPRIHPHTMTNAQPV